jgi:hypothetical protein
MGRCVASIMRPICADDIPIEEEVVEPIWLWLWVVEEEAWLAVDGW